MKRFAAILVVLSVLMILTSCDPERNEKGDDTNTDDTTRTEIITTAAYGTGSSGNAVPSGEEDWGELKPLD